MKALSINFAARNLRSAWAARLLLLVAAGFAVDAALSYQRLAASVLRAEQALSAAAPREATPRRTIAPEEVALAAETVNRLGMPWSELFSALESAATDEVALLGVEPDPKGSTVVISAEGKNYLAALSYVLNLSKAGPLSRVQLVRHEQKADDPHGAIAFAVSAAWDRP